MDKETLLFEARSGNLDAFNQLVLIYQDLVFNQAYWMVQDEELAADLTQDTFIRAFQKISQFRGGSFRSWLMRIASNAAVDVLRRKKRHPHLPLEPNNEEEEDNESASWMIDPGLPVETQVAQNEEKTVIQKALKRLPEEYRLALILTDMQALTYEEAAEVLSIPLGTIKSRVARGRVRLRELLSREMYYAVA